MCACATKTATPCVFRSADAGDGAVDDDDDAAEGCGSLYDPSSWDATTWCRKLVRHERRAAAAAAVSNSASTAALSAFLRSASTFGITVRHWHDTPALRDKLCDDDTLRQRLTQLAANVMAAGTCGCEHGCALPRGGGETKVKTQITLALPVAVRV